HDHPDTLPFPTRRSSDLPALGTLVEVDVVNAGSITSDIRVENTSPSAPSTIQATVGGHLTLTGPSGLTVQTNLSQNAGSFSASVDRKSTRLNSSHGSISY